MEDPTIRDLADGIYAEHLERMDREQPHTVPHGQGCFTKRSGKSKVKKTNCSKKSISVRVLRSTFKRTTRSRKSSRQLKDFMY